MDRQLSSKKYFAFDTTIDNLSHCGRPTMLSLRYRPFRSAQIRHFLNTDLFRYFSSLCLAEMAKTDKLDVSMGYVITGRRCHIMFPSNGEPAWFQAHLDWLWSLFSASFSSQCCWVLSIRVCFENDAKYSKRWRQFSDKPAFDIGTSEIPQFEVKLICSIPIRNRQDVVC